MPHGLAVLAVLAAPLQISEASMSASMSGGGTINIAQGVDNLLAADSVREQMLSGSGVAPIRIEADFVTCTQ